MRITMGSTIRHNHDHHDGVTGGTPAKKQRPQCHFLFVLVLFLLVQGTRAWIPLLPSPTTPTTTTTTHVNQYHRRPPRPAAALLGSTSNENEKNDAVVAMVGLNELQTLLRAAVAEEDFVEAGRISELLLCRLHGTNLTPEEKTQLRQRMSWTGLGAAPWLVDRLDALDYTFPTTVQINAMECVNAILNEKQPKRSEDTTAAAAAAEENAAVSLEERIQQNQNNNHNSNELDMGIVVSGSTGSGKTLSYLVPLLSTLSDSLFARQRLRVSAEESVADTAGDLVDRISVVTSPIMRSQIRKQKTRDDIALTGAAISTLGKSASNRKDVKSPLAVIVVPTKELGIQIALLTYQLVGGKVRSKQDAFATAFDTNNKNKNKNNNKDKKLNMFKFKGPKGIKIATILDDNEASFGLKLQTDIAITTPEYVGKLMQDQDIIPSKLRVVVYDEADLALEQTKAADLATLFEDNNNNENENNNEAQTTKQPPREYTRLTFLVGASVTESLGNLAVRSKVIPYGRSYIATATRYNPLLQNKKEDEAKKNNKEEDKDPSSSPAAASTETVAVEQEDTSIKKTEITATSDDHEEDAKSASLKDLAVCLDPGLTHQRVVVSAQSSGLLVLTKLIRKELRDYEDKTNPERPGVYLSQRPRVMVFLPNEKEAKAAIAPLRDALWGEHKLCVLLPQTGVAPLDMMEQFKNGETSVMIATPNSVRGLDFPSLTHVYTLYLPNDDPREYVHLAGRVGRIGQVGSTYGGGGRVVSVLQAGQQATDIEQLADTLGFTFTDYNLTAITAGGYDKGEYNFTLTEAGTVDVEKTDLDNMRRYLEDTITLLPTTNNTTNTNTTNTAEKHASEKEKETDSLSSSPSSSEEEKQSDSPRMETPIEDEDEDEDEGENDQEEGASYQ